MNSWYFLLSSLQESRTVEEKEHERDGATKVVTRVTNTKMDLDISWRICKRQDWLSLNQ